MLQMTATEYADKRGISPQAVRKAIARKHQLPGVTKVSRIGKVHILTVDSSALKKYLRKVA